MQHTPDRRSLRLLCLWLALCLGLIVPSWRAAAQGGGASPPPVVVAVDTSRSLSPAQLGQVVRTLSEALAELDPSTPTGLLAFDDAPRWILQPTSTPQEVGEALQGLTPRGDFTLLNDALFSAARTLDSGGIILLATDGRDENSATTVEDIARRCEAQGIRILAVGSGRGVQQRFLRRLALLTEGEYLGRLEDGNGAQLGAAVQAASEQLAQERAASPRGAGAAAPQTAAPSSGATSPAGGAEGTPFASSSSASSSSASGSAPSGGTSGGGSSGAWYSSPLWAGLVTVLLALLAFFLGRRVAESRSKVDDDLFDDSLDVPEMDTYTVDELTASRLVAFPVASMDEAPEVTVDTAVFYGSSLEDRLEKTRVLTDRGVLISRRADDSPRLYLLGYDKAFAVGRSRDENTLAIPDPALSAQHFRVVPDGQEYYVLDVGSTNGTYLNGMPVKARKLSSGDTIRAGQGEFEFQSQGGALGG